VGSGSPRCGTETNRCDSHGWPLNRENAVLILPRMVHHLFPQLNGSFGESR
jgi:hypothetical protein